MIFYLIVVPTYNNQNHRMQPLNLVCHQNCVRGRDSQLQHAHPQQYYAILMLSSWCQMLLYFLSNGWCIDRKLILHKPTLKQISKKIIEF